MYLKKQNKYHRWKTDIVIIWNFLRDLKNYILYNWITAEKKDILYIDSHLLEL